MWDVVEDMMRRRPKLFEQGGAIMLLTPCHPFRTAYHVRMAFEQFRASGADALVSVTAYPFPPELRLSVNNNRVTRDWDGLVRAGDHLVSYYPNGAVTILTQEAFMTHRSPYTGNTTAFEISWPECLDIDEPGDLELARRLIDSGVV